MVTVKIGDGMGNQMYNYACGYAAARRANEGLRLDISECDNSTLRDFELDKFHIVYDEKESFPNDSVWKKIYKRLRRNLKYHVIFEKDMYHVDERVENTLMDIGSALAILRNILTKSGKCLRRIMNRARK